jgi:O-antigen/teichoic acid export membrane protein
MDNNHSGRHDAHHTIRTVSVGTVWRMLRYPFLILSMAIIPQKMGDVVYGQYAFFMAVFMVFDALTDIGTTQIFGRFVPESEAAGDRARSSYLLHSFLYYSLLLTLVVCAGLVCAPWFHHFKHFSFNWFFLMALLVFFTKVEGTFFGFIYGLNHIGRYSAKEVMRSAFTFVLVLTLYLRFGLTGAFWGLILNEIILSVISATWIAPYLFRSTPPIRFAEVKPYALFGIQFYIPLFLFGLLQRSGNVLIQWLTHSPEQVAYFDIANQFLLLTATFLGLILATLLPSLSVLYSRGQDETIHRYHRISMTYCAVVIFLAFNASGWIGRDVIVALMGPSFAPVFPNALIMVLAIFPGLISYVGMNYCMLEKKPGVYARGVLLGLVAMVAGCWLLVPRWGSLGASWATVLGYTTLALVFYAKYHKQFITAFKHFWIAVLIGACFAPLYRFHLGVPMSVLLFGATTAVYLMMLFRLRIIRWAEVQRVVTAFSDNARS